MDDFVDNLIQFQRDDILKCGKLNKISKDQLINIIRNTNWEEYNQYDDFEDIKKQCWMWNGTIQDTVNKGHQHGKIHFNGKPVLVHRLMCHNFIDNVPEYKRESDSIQVNHNCTHEQNGRCVNPWHLYLGTPKQNMQDALNAGTKYKSPSGENNWKSKLSNNIIQEIKNLKDNTELSQKEIAIKYNVNQSQISRWWNNKTRIN